MSRRNPRNLPARIQQRVPLRTKISRGITNLRFSAASWLAGDNGFRPGTTSTFSGASYSRLFTDWVAGLLAPDLEVRWAMRTLRARARELVRNNSYAAGFVSEMANNIIGPDGIMLHAKVATLAGQQHSKTNQAIEKAWLEWDNPENASVDGQDSWVDVQHLLVKTWVTDGEIFVRHREGYDNDFGYAVQLIDPDLVDETFERGPDENGVMIRMGIEINADGRPLAYWVFRNHPSDPYKGSRLRDRIPADEIEHLFIRYRPGQTRGLTWFAPVLADMRMLGQYEQAELVAARFAAAKMGFIVNKSEAAIAAYSPPVTGQTEPRSIDVAPGVIDELNPGQEFQEFNPTHPSAAFKEFTSTVLRGVARGLGVSYASYTGDLSQANYGSLRAGLLPERDTYRTIQNRVAKKIHRRVYRRWIGNALLSGALQLDSRIGSKFYDVEWKPRGWKWIDPLKDLQAAEMAIKLGLDSRTRLAAESGRDYENIIDDLQAEEEYADAAGVDIGGISKSSKPPLEPDSAPADQQLEEQQIQNAKVLQLK